MFLYGSMSIRKVSFDCVYSMSSATTRFITTFDLLKFVIVIFMIVDHIGLYIFPDEMWWRTFGRWLGPAWFILVGYSRSRDLSAPIWIGGLILVVTSLIAGSSLFPLNSLFTIIAIRMVIDPVARFTFKSWENMFLAMFVLTLLYIPFAFLLENSTPCLLAALFGYVVRHLRDGDRGELPLFNHPRFPMVMLWTAVILGSLSQLAGLPLGPVQAVLMVLGLSSVFFFFPRLPVQEWPALTARLPAQAVKLVQFCGRRTMEIYVGHLILFKLAALILAMAGSANHIHHYGLFDWVWFYHDIPPVVQGKGE